MIMIYIYIIHLFFLHAFRTKVKQIGEIENTSVYGLKKKKRFLEWDQEKGLSGKRFE